MMEFINNEYQRYEKMIELFISAYKRFIPD